MTPRHRQEGFTLVELLVTLVIAGVLTALAVPALRDFSQSQKVKSVSFEVTSAMLMARSEAVKRNADVRVEPVVANDWTSGWTIKTVINPTTLNSQQAISGATLTGPAMITFKSSGRPTATASFQINSSSGDETVRCIRVDSTGIPSSKSEACS